MSQKILNLSEDPYKAAGRTDQRCRALIHVLRVLKGPVLFEQVCEILLESSDDTTYGGACNCVEAQMLLECDLHTCIGLGWLRKSRKQHSSKEKSGSFDAYDVFQVASAADRLDAQIPAKRSNVWSPPTITVKATERGLVAFFRGKPAKLARAEQLLLEALYLKNGAVLSSFDMKKSDVAIRQSVHRLREGLRKIRVDEISLMSGIAEESGQGYRIDSQFLHIAWRTEPVRESNVLHGLTGSS